jgi:hypothetical protein
MATNKNQHFVPRCYLRPFTMDGAEAAINLYNLDRKRFISSAPLKNQCSRDYFYGQDERLEHAIQLIESGYAASLRRLLANNKKLSSDEQTLLQTFWLFQHLRTEAAAKRAVQMSVQTREIVGIEEGDFSIGIKDAVLMAVRAFADNIKIVDDLKFCLIRNKSEYPFITSDNPAILTNRWHLQDSRAIGRSFGFNSSGILIFLPLSPRLLFLGYDGGVYNVTHDNHVVDVKSDRDIIAFNQHQFLQCNANVYFQAAESAEVIHQAYLNIESNRPDSRYKIIYAELDGMEKGFERYVPVNPKDRNEHKTAIVHTQSIHPEPTIWPSQIRFRSKGYVYSNGTAVGYIRKAKTSTRSDVPFQKEFA